MKGDEKARVNWDRMRKKPPSPKKTGACWWQVEYVRRNYNDSGGC